MRSLLLDGVDARTIGPLGFVSDLSWQTRWGSGACGMHEASWSMPLPAGYDHPLLRRGTKVEIMDGPVKIGSSLVLSSPERGSDLSDPWTFTASGVGHEVEGDNAWYALDLSLNTTAIPSTAADAALVRGLQWNGRDGTVPTTAVGTSSTTDALNSIGSLFTAAADGRGQRWGVDDQDTLRFYSDPTVPMWQTVPGVSGLGTADDDYASVVYVRYIDTTSGQLATVGAINSTMSVIFKRREYSVDLQQLGPISSTQAQGFADGILAKSKGRMGWSEGLTLTANELLTTDGVPADLSMVEAGQMIRLNGLYDDLLEITGRTWTDIVIGETKYSDGAQTIDIAPLGLVSRDLAAVVEEVTGLALDAA